MNSKVIGLLLLCITLLLGYQVWSNKMEKAADRRAKVEAEKLLAKKMMDDMMDDAKEKCSLEYLREHGETRKLADSMGMTREFLEETK